MVEPTCELLHHWGQAGKIISKLQMDNAGENKELAMQLQSASWKNPVAVEYTTRDTPQQNSPVEVAFYALAKKACAMMHHANLPMEMQYCLFGEIFTTVTLLDGLTVIELSGKNANRYEHFFGETPKFMHSLHTVGEAGTMEMQYCLFGEIFTTVTLLDGLTVIELSGKDANRYEHFFGETPKFMHSLHTVGEAGTVKIKTDTTPKLEDCRIHCLFMGYSLLHASRCY